MLEKSLLSPADVITPSLPLKAFQTQGDSWEIAPTEPGKWKWIRDAERRHKKNEVARVSLVPISPTGCWNAREHN